MVQLLDHETRAAEQVPLLLGMREDGRALEKAVDSGDTDLGESRRFPNNQSFSGTNSLA